MVSPDQRTHRKIIRLCLIAILPYEVFVVSLLYYTFCMPLHWWYRRKNREHIRRQSGRKILPLGYFDYAYDLEHSAFNPSPSGPLETNDTTRSLKSKQMYDPDALPSTASALAVPPYPAKASTTRLRSTKRSGRAEPTATPSIDTESMVTVNFR